MSVTDVGVDFVFWLERSSNFAPVIKLPMVRAAEDLAKQTLARGTFHGRITLWLWTRQGVKMALAMARLKGDGGERSVRVIRREPPFRDDDKCEVVLKGERA